MQSNEELVVWLKNNGVLKTPRIIRAFLEIDRGDFVSSEFNDQAYDDVPLPLMRGQTISQPSTVAIMLELLDPRPGNWVLDVGSGSGWTTALLTEAIGPTGRVVGLEIVPELVEMGRENLARYHLKNVEIRQSDKEFGVIDELPFNRILVSAEAKKLPKELLDELRPSGRMVIPIEGSLFMVTKNTDGSIEEKEYPGFAFVPLIH